MPTPDQIRAAQETRQRFLFALYDRERQGEHMPSAQDVAADVGIDPEDWARIEGVTEPLRQDGLIDGLDTAEVRMVCVRLTGEGRRFVERSLGGEEVAASPAAAPASVGDINVSGSGNVLAIQQHAPGAAQEVDYTSGDFRRIRAWVADVEEKASRLGLGAEDTDEVREEAARLRGELEAPAPNGARVESLGKRLARLLNRAAPSLVTAGVIETGKALFLAPS